MTKFIDRSNSSKNEKKTIFRFVLNQSFQLKRAMLTPKDFKIVEFLRHDKVYGDLFYAYSGDPDLGTFYFGTKGDEFI
jgi:hypothetical protein